MPRSIATALTLVLLLGMLPAASAAAAEDGPPSRTPADAIGTSLDLDVLMSASHELALDTALKVQVASLKLDVAKAAQRERARQYRRDKRAVKKALSGKERDCRLVALELTYLAERDRFEAEATEYRAELGYYNKQKALTKVGKRFGRAARFVGGVLMETIKEVGPVVLEAQLTGGLGPGGWKALARRHGVRTLKRKGKDALFGALVRRATGPADAALATATEECEPEAAVVAAKTQKDSPAPSATGRDSGRPAMDYVCELECEHCAPRPPYGEPAFLIHLHWTDPADVRLNYWVAEPGSGPYAGAYWSGGCVDGVPPQTCLPVEPLILTEEWVSGNNLWPYPGELELKVEPVPCYFDGDTPEDLGEEGPRHLGVCKRIGKVAVTATIEYHPGGSGPPMPVASGLTASLPLYPCEGAPDAAKYRHTLESFKWDPATGITFGDSPREPAPASGGAGSDEEAPWDRE